MLWRQPCSGDSQTDHQVPLTAPTNKVRGPYSRCTVTGRMTDDLMTGITSCIYCKHDGPPHSTVMVRSTKHQRRCEGCPTCKAEIAAEDDAARQGSVDSLARCVERESVTPRLDGNTRSKTRSRPTRSVQD
jgi:hypothetical protein